MWDLTIKIIRLWNQNYKNVNSQIFFHNHKIHGFMSNGKPRLMPSEWKRKKVRPKYVTARESLCIVRKIKEKKLLAICWKRKQRWRLRAAFHSVPNGSRVQARAKILQPQKHSQVRKQGFDGQRPFIPVKTMLHRWSWKQPLLYFCQHNRRPLRFHLATLLFLVYCSSSLPQIASGQNNDESNYFIGYLESIYFCHIIISFSNICLRIGFVLNFYGILTKSDRVKKVLKGRWSKNR